MKIALTSFFVNDPAEAHTFYTEVLGFKSRMFMPEAKMAIVFSAEDPNGVNLMLEPKDNEIGKNFRNLATSQAYPLLCSRRMIFRKNMKGC